MIMNSKFQLNDIQDYGSEFSDCNSEVEFARKQKKREDDALYRKPDVGRLGLLRSGKSSLRKPSKRVAQDLLDVEEGKRMRYHGLLAMDAYSRHKKLVNDYLFIYGGKTSDFKRDSSRDRTDQDIIRENHHFLWDEDDDNEASWGRRLAKKYWDKLYKEYAICDLSRYKENKVAFRWRVEKEVVSGKGQFVCGNKRCDEKDGLRSWEVNFAYLEDNAKKNALVKCRLCAECSYKLNYFHKKKDVTKPMKTSKKSKHKKKHKHHEKTTSEPDSASDTSPSSSTKVRDKSRESEEHKIWSQPLQIENERSREEEFDDYFEGLFL